MNAEFSAINIKTIVDPEENRNFPVNIDNAGYMVMNITTSPDRFPSARSILLFLPQMMEFESSGKIVPSGIIRSEIKYGETPKSEAINEIDFVKKYDDNNRIVMPASRIANEFLLLYFITSFSPDKCSEDPLE